MAYQALREELHQYYLNDLPPRVEAFYADCTKKLDDAYEEGMSVYDMKRLQDRIISDEIDPVVFRNSPFFYSTATFLGRNHYSPTARWTYNRNEHFFWEQDEELYRLRKIQTAEKLYTICGVFNDSWDHFGFYYRPILKGGLRSVYEKALAQMEGANETETAFLSAVCEGLLAIRKLAGKFAQKAETLAQDAQDEESRLHYERIARTAARIPWEKPESFYEALCVYLFMKEMVEALDGIGSNTFGRLDMDLWDIYQQDLKCGALTEEEAYDLICRFLLCSDCRYDHDMKMVGSWDHEMENTYVLGGCDAEGKPFYNDLTRLFLTATREEKIIYPKIKCRFGENSPKAYLDEINKAVIAGNSAILYQNDDAVIEAFLRAGRPIEECRDYLVSGCWDILCNGVEKIDSATYFNLIKPFEYSVHRLYDKMELVGVTFETLDDAKDFEEVYRITIENLRRMMKERMRVTCKGGRIWDRVDILPIYSSTLGDCLENRKDFTSGGAKYHDEKLMCLGLPNLTDSLLAIKTLCFDTGRYTLKEFLNAVRSNWEGYEDMQIEAIRCHGWGDGNEDSCELANRITTDVFNMASEMETTYGGKLFIGHLTYTEIRFWGEQTLATPDGRKNGEYFSQGLTPSRLKKIPSSTSVIESLASLDRSMLAGNSVVNVILPSNKVSLDTLEAFLRASATTAMQSLQLNCFTKEQLLDAQKHPENHRDLVVRVTGFSARFTSLSPEWQHEVLTRNFYEN